MERWGGSGAGGERGEEEKGSARFSGARFERRRAIAEEAHAHTHAAYMAGQRSAPGGREQARTGAPGGRAGAHRCERCERELARQEGEPHLQDHVEALDENERDKEGVASDDNNAVKLDVELFWPPVKQPYEAKRTKGANNRSTRGAGADSDKIRCSQSSCKRQAVKAASARGDGERYAKRREIDREGKGTERESGLGEREEEKGRGSEKESGGEGARGSERGSTRESERGIQVEGTGKERETRGGKGEPPNPIPPHTHTNARMAQGRGGAGPFLCSSPEICLLAKHPVKRPPITPPTPCTPNASSASSNLHTHTHAHAHAHTNAPSSTPPLRATPVCRSWRARTCDVKLMLDIDTLVDTVLAPGLPGSNA